VADFPYRKRCFLKHQACRSCSRLSYHTETEHRVFSTTFCDNLGEYAALLASALTLPLVTPRLMRGVGLILTQTRTKHPGGNLVRENSLALWATQVRKNCGPDLLPRP